MVRKKLNAYIHLSRLHRPVGIFLLMLPCWWGLALAGPSAWNLKFLLLFALGSATMRGAGCILNDLIDQDIDRQVARTKDRPLTRGDISCSEAIALFVLHCIGGLLVLLMLPPRCWFLAPIGLTLLAIYPFMKRITHWPQLILGLAFNLGVIFGAVAITPYESINWLAILSLYGAGIAWTIGYDTIYALQDKEDDLKIGVKSTAIRFGSHARAALGVTYGIMFLLLGSVGYWMESTVSYYSLISLGALAAAFHLFRLDLSNTSACLKAFNLNPYLGWLIWAALELILFKL